MKTSGAVALALALVANCYADTFSHNMNPREYYEARFYDWMAEYNVKFADGDEYVRRLQNFADADDRIEAHNAKESKFRMDHNQYSHLTWPEFRQHKAIGRPLLTKPATRDVVPEDSVAVMERRVLDNPKLAGLFAWSDIGAGKSDDQCLFDTPADKSVDWTTKGAVTPVKNQGQCGSCWAFSTTGALEGAYFKTYNQLVSMSEQSLVDCDNEDQGCNGGLMDLSFDWIQKNGGICREEDYPYQGSGGQCNRQCSKIKGTKIHHWCDVPVNNMEALMAAVTQQPVAIAIEADQMAFQFYSGGVLTGTCGTNLDHGVLLVGYGVAADGTKYWKVKNSWGADWGDHGYILLERGAPQEGGECGILMSASYPVLKK